MFHKTTQDISSLLFQMDLIQNFQPERGNNCKILTDIISIFCLPSQQTKSCLKNVSYLTIKSSEIHIS